MVRVYRGHRLRVSSSSLAVRCLPPIPGLQDTQYASTFIKAIFRRTSERRGQRRVVRKIRCDQWELKSNTLSNASKHGGIPADLRTSTNSHIYQCGDDQLQTKTGNPDSYSFAYTGTMNSTVPVRAVQSNARPYHTLNQLNNAQHGAQMAGSQYQFHQPNRNLRKALESRCITSTSNRGGQHAPVVVMDLPTSETLDTRPDLKSKQAIICTAEIRDIDERCAENVISTVASSLDYRSLDEPQKLPSWMELKLTWAIKSFDFASESFKLLVKHSSCYLNDYWFSPYVGIRPFAPIFVQQFCVIMHDINKSSVAGVTLARDNDEHLINGSAVVQNRHSWIVEKSLAQVVDIKASRAIVTNIDSYIATDKGDAANSEIALRSTVTSNTTTNLNWSNGCEEKSLSHRRIAPTHRGVPCEVHLHAAMNRAPPVDFGVSESVRLEKTEDSLSEVVVKPAMKTVVSSGSYKGGDSGKHTTTADALDFDETGPSSPPIESRRGEDVELSRRTVLDQRDITEKYLTEKEEQLEADYFSHSETSSSSGDGNDRAISDADDNFESTDEIDDLSTVNSLKKFSSNQPVTHLPVFTVRSRDQDKQRRKIGENSNTSTLKRRSSIDNFLLTLNRQRRGFPTHSVTESLNPSSTHAWAQGSVNENGMDDDLVILSDGGSGSGEEDLLDSIEGSGLEAAHKDPETSHIDKSNMEENTYDAKSAADDIRKGEQQQEIEELNIINTMYDNKRKHSRQRSYLTSHPSGEEPKKTRRNAADARKACPTFLPLLPDNIEMKTSMTFGGYTVDMSCHCSPIKERSQVRRIETDLPTVSEQPAEKDDEEAKPITRDEAVARRDKRVDESISKSHAQETDVNYQADAADYQNDQGNNQDDGDIYVLSSLVPRSGIRYYFVNENQVEKGLLAVDDFLRHGIGSKKSSPSKNRRRVVFTDKPNAVHLEDWAASMRKRKTVAEAAASIPMNSLDDKPDKNEHVLTSPNKAKMGFVFKNSESSGKVSSSDGSKGANAAVNGEGPSSSNGPYLEDRSDSSHDTSHRRVSGNESRQEAEKAECRPYDGLNGKARPQNRQPPPIRCNPTRSSGSLRAETVEGWYRTTQPSHPRSRSSLQKQPHKASVIATPKHIHYVHYCCYLSANPNAEKPQQPLFVHVKEPVQQSDREARQSVMANL
ncbi:teneurin-3-like [Tropilaelaps mercedesae]|uniref:Teneurin-3-like n=1 Tax=Tropilaelaps mercedesae TaxID=418985 RepID=A0A1V9Y1V5_9ACAR|nr:teneurin-3-like [Tropilaelaps mercedesae]